MPSLAAARSRIVDMAQSLAFNVSSTQKAYETSAAAAYAVSPLTLGCWVWRVAALGANPQTLIGKGKASSSNLSYALQLTQAGAIRTDTSTNGTTSTQVTTTTVTVPENEWHHIAMSYDGTTVNIFFDGVNVRSAAGAGTLWTGPGFMPITIGACSGAVGTTAFGAAARIQEAFVTTQLLTAGQIAALMVEGAQKIIGNSATTSIWIVGEDVGINGTTATDVGNGASPLTLSGVSVDWYGRTRTRLPYNGMQNLPMMIPIGANTGLATDGTNGWNVVARPTDIALVSWAQQANSSAITKGQILWYYATYDTASGGAGGSTPTLKSDVDGLVPVGAGATILGYDNEGWTNTIANEQNSVSIAQTAANYAHTHGYQFAMIPSWSFLSGNVAGYAGITNMDYLVLQTQNFDWSVDTFTSTVFPVLKSIIATAPTLKLVLQMQPLSANVPKGCDHVDLAQAAWNAHQYCLSLGGVGVYSWGEFIGASTFTSWTNLRKTMRPGARTAVTRSTLRP